MTLLRILESVHGYLAMMAVAAVIHPAILLRKGKGLSRRNRWAISFAGVLPAVAFGAGMLIYQDYRVLVRRGLFQASPAAGFLFETKEHLGFAAIVLAAGACVCALVAPKDSSDLRKLSALAFAISFVLLLLVSGMGTWVTALHSF